MIDPGLLATSWTSAGPALGGIATFFILFVLPAAWFFHRKVIRPLSFVLGLKAEESPTGEPIPSIPVQLAEMRRNQEEFKGQIKVINAEVHPNGGSSMRDVVDRNDRNTRDLSMKVVDLQESLDKHLAEERREREKIAALALKAAADLAALTAKTASELARKPGANS
jgi:hypothetical protein